MACHFVDPLLFLYISIATECICDAFNISLGIGYVSMTLLFIMYIIGFCYHLLQVNWLFKSFHIHIVQGLLDGGQSCLIWMHARLPWWGTDSIVGHRSVCLWLCIRLVALWLVIFRVCRLQSSVDEGKDAWRAIIVVCFVLRPVLVECRIVDAYRIVLLLWN
jgi:hypothetical protein